MAKIIFPNITITPSNGSTGQSPAARPVIRIPHIAGTGTNGIPQGYWGRPVVTGANSITSAVGGLLDQNGANGKVWRLREAADIAGNVVPSSPVIAATITDSSPVIYPPVAYTLVQFAPAGFTSSKFYKIEIEEELEYTTYQDPSSQGGGVIG